MHAAAARPLASLIRYGADWSEINDPDAGLLIEPRAPVAPATEIEAALDRLDATLSFAGPLAELAPTLAELPPLLSADILRLAARFSDLTGNDRLRLRLERVETDACRKWHLDHTDLRLVVTYRGPGTQFRLAEAGPVEQIAKQSVALFKGRDFGPDHAMIFHRSPPIAGTGARRLVLVVDTPLKPRDAAFYELASHADARGSFQ